METVIFLAFFAVLAGVFIYTSRKRASPPPADAPDEGWVRGEQNDKR